MQLPFRRRWQRRLLAGKQILLRHLPAPVHLALLLLNPTARHEEPRLSRATASGPARRASGGRSGRSRRPRASSSTPERGRAFRRDALQPETIRPCVEGAGAGELQGLPVWMEPVVDRHLTGVGTGSMGLPCSTQGHGVLRAGRPSLHGSCQVGDVRDLVRFRLDGTVTMTAFQSGAYTGRVRRSCGTAKGSAPMNRFASGSVHDEIEIDKEVRQAACGA